MTRAVFLALNGTLVTSVQGIFTSCALISAVQELLYG